MTILSDGEIARALAEGSLVIKPAPDLSVQLQPASVDLRLGNLFTRYKSISHENHGGTQVNVVDVRHSDVGAMMETIEQGIVEIPSGAFILGHTHERVEIPNNIVAVVDGRSSLGRLGIMVHVTAGYIDPGFSGQITLELHNVSSRTVRLYAGDRVCQLRFHRMAEASTSPYSGKYQGDHGAVASRIKKDER